MIGAPRPEGEGKRRPGSIRRLLSNTGFVMGAEVVNRVTRIAAAVALAYAFDVVTFGFAVAALTTHELVRMFIQNGLGTRIVAANERELDVVAASVHSMNWILGWILLACQLAFAVAVARHLGSNDVGLAIAALAIVHIIYPLSMVHVYVAQRQDRWRLLSAVMAAASATDNILTAILALAGFGIASIVLPKLVIALAWVGLHRRFIDWQPAARTTWEDMRALMPFSARVVGVELLAGVRTHGDKALVGMLLGPASLGIYGFASNIGRGVPQSLSSAFAAIVLPMLRRAREAGHLRSAYVSALLVGLLATIPFAGGLALTADWLVPLVFGDKWAPAVPLLVVLALGGLSMPLLNVTSQFLRAHDRTGLDLAISACVTVTMLGAFLATLGQGLLFAAITAALVQAAASLAAVAWVLRPDAPVAGHNIQREALT
jgi:PST family polysaccharide transporter